ncbi:MAG TPA: thiamine pyrophosphate-dependent dehydrogenase E1 component subunit alpha [Streptosporangiaceae bacterium]|nr:thiamine pyrophosphate-dependent dehydrogenase E1 component subunit alpha [Streptosporangiaceae bacterium]
MTDTSPASQAAPSHDTLRISYKMMRLIREFEDRLHADFPSGDIPGAVHLSAGQEAIAVGVCAHLGPRDYLASTHRGHGHAIAKRCDIDAMMLEIYGKARGLCLGRGGSMHIADFDLGMLGANGVAAGGVPLACGAALTSKLAGDGRVAVAFVGDGGVNQGAFYESLCLAAVWQLPVVFVVEDNGYAQATGTAYHLRGIEVAQRAAPFGIPAATVDGCDFFAVWAAAGQAVARARAGGGPSLIECRAVRLYGHMEGWDTQRYRAPGEVDELRATRDPLRIFHDRVLRDNLLSLAEVAYADSVAKTIVDGAVAIARNAPDPTPDVLTDDVYASATGAPA